MENDYWFQVIKENKTEFAAFDYQIKWNILHITKDTCADGYLVQHVIFHNNSRIKISDCSYFEAWEVREGLCINPDKDEYDDRFSLWMNGIEDCFDGLVSSSGTSGSVMYDSEVYWIPSSNALSRIVSSWRINTVPNAGNLKSSNTFEGVDLIEPLFCRFYVHKWAFQDEDKIIASFVKLAPKVFKESVSEVNIRLNLSYLNISTAGKERVLEQLSNHFKQCAQFECNG